MEEEEDNGPFKSIAWFETQIHPFREGRITSGFPNFGGPRRSISSIIRNCSEFPLLAIYRSWPKLFVQSPKYPLSKANTGKRVLIVDDQTMFRELLTSKCRNELGYNVIGACATGDEAIALCREHRPEIALLGLHLGDSYGLAISKDLLAIAPDLKILILSSGCQEVIVKHIPNTEIMGYIDKNSTVEELDVAFESIERGKKYYCKSFLEVQRKARKDPAAWTKTISDAELKVLPLLGAGLDIRQIAVQVGVREETVASHRRSIMNKLKISGQHELMQFCLEKGFISPATGGGRIFTFTT